MPKVLISRNMGEDAMSVIADGLKGYEIIVWPEDHTADRAWLLENITGCRGILVTLSDKVDEELLEKAGPSLIVVSTMSVGYEHVRVQALAARNIKLGYTPDVLTDAVADVAILLALMAARNAAQGLSIVQSGGWPSVGWAPFGFCGPQLGPGPTAKSFTAGFLGFGRISQATLKRLIPFGVTHAIYTNSGKGRRNESEDKEFVDQHAAFGRLKGLKWVTLDELASESDVVFLLAPGGENTRHIISTAFLQRMKKTAILVNPGRGTLVDSNALAEALDKRWLYAAGLDVVDGEPNISTEHPLVKSPFATVLPHIGSATFETRAAMADLAARNLVAGVLEEPLPVEYKMN